MFGSSSSSENKEHEDDDEDAYGLHTDSLRNLSDSTNDFTQGKFNTLLCVSSYILYFFKKSLNILVTPFCITIFTSRNKLSVLKLLFCISVILLLFYNIVIRLI